MAHHYDRLVQVRDARGRLHVGAVSGDVVVDLTTAHPSEAASVVQILVSVTERELLSRVEQLAEEAEQAGPRWSYGELMDGEDPEWRLDAPIHAPEIWGAGVTYRASRSARQQESEVDSDFYRRVYDSDRPEIFLKTSQMLRVTAPGEPIGLRSDSSSTIPEPELALVLGYCGEIAGYTIADDVTARDIEAQNPLYLPQAKIFNGCCAIGPSVLIAGGDEDPHTWSITLDIARGDELVFTGSTSVKEMTRSLDSLVQFLSRSNKVMPGTVLMTGTGVVPAEDFALQPGDRVSISIPELGTLTNVVATPTR